MNLKAVPLSPDNERDFYNLHSDRNNHGWCYCIAWWTPTWEAWTNRTAEENQKMREQLFDAGVYDGYLLYDDNKPIGWCQCCKRDLLHKLVLQYELEKNDEMYAVTCFVIAPDYREIGLGKYLLDEVIKDLKKKGIKYLQAFPRRGEELAVDDLWTGPEKYFIEAEFEIVQDDPRFPIYMKKLKD